MSMIRKYHNHKTQTTPWHCEEEPLNHHETPGRQIKQSNQPSSPSKSQIHVFIRCEKNTLFFLLTNRVDGTMRSNFNQASLCSYFSEFLTDSNGSPVIQTLLHVLHKCDFDLCQKYIHKIIQSSRIKDVGQVHDPESAKYVS